MLVKLQGLNEDLEGMVDMFTRVVKSARIRADQGGGAGSDLGDVLVESLVAKGSAALEKAAALDKTIGLGSADMQVYTRVKATQHRLQGCAHRHTHLFAATDGAPAARLRELLTRLERHYYASAASLPAAAGTQSAADAEVEELCAQALHAAIELPRGPQARR